MRATLLCGDALTVLRTLPDGAARCCVTSPPYFGLRDYGVEGQIGLEATPDTYVARLVDVFREVRRVLKDDGTLWLVLGDSYARAVEKGGSGPGGKNGAYSGSYTLAASARLGSSDGAVGPADRPGTRGVGAGLKPKDLIGIPWRVAFALQADGWYLRSDIIWHKPNPMPESVRDRPTKAHEYVFLLAKQERYFLDADAVAEPSTGQDAGNGFARPHRLSVGGRGDPEPWTANIEGTRNIRDVWTIATRPYKGAHFATMPPELAERCILAGSAPGDIVLDPFGGSGTTAATATGHRRRAIHIDLNPAYLNMARERIGPMMCETTSDALTV